MGSNRGRLGWIALGFLFFYFIGTIQDQLERANGIERGEERLGWEKKRRWPSKGVPPAPKSQFGLGGEGFESARTIS